MKSVELQPIGWVKTPYQDKFGVPRQAGLAPAVAGRLIFESEYRREEAVRGLEGFSHLWIIFLFDRVEEEEVRLSVRPPRLGGNEKVGVFATRSPYRPNRIGLSACRLLEIDWTSPEGPTLLLGGVDLVDGTPVLDVKPYLPYADQVVGAEAGLAPAAPPTIQVVVAEGVREDFGEIPLEEQEVILQTLGLDARPAFHKGRRTYFLRIFGYEVAWEMRGSDCVVTGFQKLSDPEQ